MLLQLKEDENSTDEIATLLRPGPLCNASIAFAGMSL